MRRVIPLLVVLAACGGPEAVSEDQASSPVSAPAPATADTKVHLHRKGTAPAPSATLLFDDVQPADLFQTVTLFSIGTAQVYIAADWQGVSGVHTQQVDILDPNGLLYSSTTTQFATTTAATGSQVQAVPLSDGSYRVWSTFQVAGTPVEMYHLVGAWTVSVSLDGGAALATSTFTLQ